jgi:enoyl-CoA hydratase/carnithine racemase
MLARTRLGAIHAHLVRAFSTPIGTDKVLYDRKNPYVLEVTLNKEKALNALDSEMIASLSQNVEQWNKDPNLKVVLMRGKGKKAFCAGGDVKTLYDARVAEKNPNVEPEVLDSFFRSEFECDYKLASMKPLQIALWDGIVMGGGVGISIHAPFRIATENSMFAMPEAKLGFFTDVSGGYFLSRLKDNFGLYLGLTSQRLKGMDLVRAGVANYYIPSERVPELEKRLFDNPKPESLSKSALGETIKSLSEKVDGELPNAAVIKK